MEAATAEITGEDDPRGADALRVEANEAGEEATAREEAGPPLGLVGLGLLAAAAGLAVPGMGHVLVGRWGRGLLLFGMVGALAVVGYGLRGNVFDAHPHDVFHLLGFLSDAGSGIFYLLGRRMEWNGPDVSVAAGDYGTRFIAASGVVNLLCALDAYDIAVKEKI